MITVLFILLFVAVALGVFAMFKHGKTSLISMALVFGCIGVAILLIDF